MNIEVVNVRDKTVGPFERIHRPHPLGNPFVIGKHGTREQVIEKYREWLHDEGEDYKHIHDELERLLKIAQCGTLRLGCFCAPKPCHGDVIRETLLEMAGEL